MSRLGSIFHKVVSYAEKTPQLFVRVETDDGDSFSVPLASSDITILQVKHWISNTLKIASNHLTLLSEGHKLDDGMMVKELELYGSSPRLQLVTHNEFVAVLHSLGLEELGITLDVDLTDVVDDGKKHMEGSWPYVPPFSWTVWKLNPRKRHLNNRHVSNGFNTEGRIMYSPVQHDQLGNVFRSGYNKPERCFPDSPIDDIIATADPAAAANIAQAFCCNNKQYKVLVMNCVNPAAINTVPLDHGSKIRELYTIRLAKDIHPIGIVLKRSS